MRKVIQFQVVKREDGHIIFGLCDDGTMWTIRDTDSEWWPVINIPQDSINDTCL